MRSSALLALLLAAACKPSAPAPGRAPAAPAAVKPEAAVAPAPPPATHEREGGEALTGELAREAGQRPTGTPTAEAVLDALEAGGIHVERRRQVPARVHQASYCMTGLLAGGASAAVCEYSDEAAAGRGQELAQKRPGALPGLRVFVNRKTTLSLAGADELADKIAAIFAGL